MKELELTVRVSFHGEYENSRTEYIEVPDNTPEDKLMDVMLRELWECMEDAYGDYEEWKDGDISWTIYDWKEI